MAGEEKSCPVLTVAGRKLISENIKDAIFDIIVYGVPRNDLVGKEELHALLQNERTTAEVLEKFKIVEKKPLVSFFDVDGKLTVRVNLSYDDLIRKDVTIEGIGILGKDGQIVSLFPDYAVLDNPQANLEALIKIHSVVGEPGAVEYYTGTYLTREEYEAAKVPMVNEVFNRTNAIVEPKIKQVMEDFKVTGTQILEAHKDNFEVIKAQYARELEEIKIQATQDLTGIQDYISKLHRLGRFEQRTIHLYRNLCTLYKNLYNMFEEAICLFQRAKAEAASFGTLQLFSSELPDDYLYFNAWYPISDYLCFYNNYVLNVVTSPDGSKFMVKWDAHRENDADKKLDSLYIKAKVSHTPYAVMEHNHQKLPKPFLSMTAEDYGRWDKKLKWKSVTYRQDYFERPDWYLISQTEITPRFDITYGGEDYFYQRDFTLNFSHWHTVTGNLNNPTYQDNKYQTVEAENTHLILGIKAGLSFNIKDELAKIMDKAFVDC